MSIPWLANCLTIRATLTLGYLNLPWRRPGSDSAAIHPNTTAIFCITLPAAMGLMRAAADAGVHIGQDLSVCVLDGEGIAAHLVPSLTSFKAPQVSGSLSAVIEWLAAGGNPDDWIGPLLVEPSQLTLFEGESTRNPVLTKALTGTRP